MKKIFAIFLFVLAFVFAPTAFAAERIEDFQSAITIASDATVTVVENIKYDFGSGQRHGIYREIPLVYENSEGKKYKIDFDLKQVLQDGKRSTTKETKSGKNIRIRIGDADAYVSGVVNYKIEYSVRGVITYFSDHDELYWDVTGNEWEAPIQGVGASIAGIGKIGEIENFKETCYTGPEGSTARDCTVSFDEKNGEHVVSTNSSLDAGEGLTVVLSFPKGLVSHVEPKEYGKLEMWQIVLFIILAIVAFFYYLVAPLYLIYRFLRYGRDPKTGKAVSAWYDPPTDKTGRLLTPGEAGTLIDEHVDPKDISATIVHLAIRGYVKIKELKKKLLQSQDYEFTLINKKYHHDESMQPFERKILNVLFKNRDKVTTKTLAKSFYKDAPKIEDMIYKSMQEKGFFPHNPKKVRTKYYIIGMLSLFTMNFPLGLLCLMLGRHMPKKTLFGAEKHMVGLGLKNFLSSQERQLKFQAKNWMLFERLLPYAIVFGVEKVWAKRFADLAAQPPGWYEGSYSGHTFNSVLLASSLSNSMNRVNTISRTTSTRSSSGFSSGFSGGSSGGGFGGGGGGSW